MGVVVIFVWGLITTILTVGIRLLISGSDFDPMSFYLWHLVPVGAIITGFLAASGYLLAIRLTRTQLRPWMLPTILALHLMAYFGGEFLVFKLLNLHHTADGSPVGFWELFDLQTRNYTMMGLSAGKDAGKPLELWGYGIRFLEVVGFMGGAFAVPMAVANVPLCPTCKRYQNRASLGLISALPNEIEKTQRILNELQAALDNGNAKAFSELLTENRISEEKGRMPGTLVAFSLVWCPACQTGVVASTTTGADGEALIEEALTPDFLKSLDLTRLVVHSL